MQFDKKKFQKSWPDRQVFPGQSWFMCVVPARLLIPRPPSEECPDLINQMLTQMVTCGGINLLGGKHTPGCRVHVGRQDGEAPQS